MFCCIISLTCNIALLPSSVYLHEIQINIKLDFEQSLMYKYKNTCLCKYSISVSQHCDFAGVQKWWNLWKSLDVNQKPSHHLWFNWLLLISRQQCFHKISKLAASCIRNSGNMHWDHEETQAVSGSDPKEDSKNLIRSNKKVPLSKLCVFFSYFFVPFISFTCEILHIFLYFFRALKMYRTTICLRVTAGFKKTFAEDVFQEKLKES